jgi:hypothetical protein
MLCLFCCILGTMCPFRPKLSQSRWWLSAAAAHNGVFSLARRQTTHFVFTDACLSPAPCIGIFLLRVHSSPLLGQQLGPPSAEEDINVLECFALVATLQLLVDYSVVYYDNAATVSGVGQGSPRPLAARDLLGRLFSDCLRRDIRLSVQHIPGVDNVIADALSRRQWSTCSAGVPPPLCLACVVPSLPQV